MKLEEIVGQQESKKKIEFYRKAFKSGQPFPPMIALGARGQGKTELMESTAIMLRDETNGIKKAVEINASVIKNMKGFWNNIAIPNLSDRDVTLFIDEAHRLPL